jgi:hypothetical protein
MQSNNLKHISILDPPEFVPVSANLFVNHDVIMSLGLDYSKEIRRQLANSKEIRRQLAIKILQKLESEDLIEYRTIDNPAQDGIEMHARIKVFSPYPTLNIML